MRFYNIAVSDSSGNAVRTWTSYVNGQTDPGALDVEFDLPVAGFAQPMGSSGGFVRIWGISLQDIGQASNLNGMSIQVSGGMSAGLPLANPAQQGLLVGGTIFQAFGNWIGVNQTLDLNIVAGASGTMNIPHTWKAGQKLSDAMKSTLTTAFPGYTADIQISDSLVLAHDEVGYYTNIIQYAQYIRNISASVIGGSTSGVDIILRDKTLIVRDDTNPGQPKQISYNDLMGQPTWIGPQQIQISTVMRGDISVLDYVKLPPTLATTTPQSMSQSRDSSVFQGAFRVYEIRHVGRFRQPSGDAWMTIMNATSTPKKSGTVSISDLGGLGVRQ